MKKTTLLFFILGLSKLPLLYSQSTLSKSGLHFIRNYTSKEYGGHTQNWAAVQDHSGVMYFGNTSGVLEYDGVSWRLIPLLGTTRVVFSLAIDKDGKIYLGSFNELGYLAPDSVGQLSYVSLVEHLPEKHRQFANVWRTFATDSGIYFTTPKYIIRWSNGQFETWKAKTTFFLSFHVRGQLFIFQKNTGLMHLDGDSLKMVPGSDKFLKERIAAILPFDEERLLVVSGKQGLYLLDGCRIEPFSLGSNEVIEKKTLYVGTNLGMDRFAVSIFGGGIIFFNRAGEVQALIDKSTGLQDNAVHYLHPDREGGLWLALNNGISRVEISSPQTYYDERVGLNGKVQRCLRHRGTLYVTTNTGVYAVATPAFHSEAKRDVVTRLPEIGESWGLLSMGNALLIASRDRIYEVQDERQTGQAQVSVISDYDAYDIIRSRQDSNRFFLALSDGLASMYRDPIRQGQSAGASEWIDTGKIQGVKERIRWLAEDSKGNLWLATSYKGVLRVTFEDAASLLRPAITRFDTSHGLPSMKGIRVFGTDDRVYFGTEEGAYIFNKARQRFIEAPGLGAAFTDGREVHRIAPAPGSRDLWMVLFDNSYEAGVARFQGNGRYEWFSAPFLRFADLQINVIYPEADGVVWLGTSDGLIRHDTRVDKNYELDYSALIRRVTVHGDSVIFGGITVQEGPDDLSVLGFADNALRFEYAAASYDGSVANRFQYFLEGFDQDWSGWTGETKKDYTNLSEGEYRFRVRARNVYGHISSEDGFAFEILPPWYRTPWAYIAYGLLFFGLFIGGVKWRSRQLVKEKEALEKIVVERTEEVRSQAEKLKEMDKVKSRFFANISHEFRTPLTLIIDPLKEMIAGKFIDDLKQQYDLMHRNAQRLLRLINQLLDLSKLESGSIALETVSLNVIPFLKGLVNAFASLAESKKIELQFTAEEEEIELYFDPDKLEKIVNNLLSNAFKFTPEGGSVSVGVSKSPLEEPVLSSPKEGVPRSGTGDVVQITVKDTGVGIPEDRVPYVFDRFYQVDGSHTREHEGTGIGLALTKELVELHHGEIHVTSQEGKGTEFVIRLPLGKEHLQEAEIVDERAMGVVAPTGVAELPIEEITQTVEHPSEGSIERNQVLVVEDNADVRSYIRQHLEPTHEVAEAKDGAEGVALALKTIPDLIISDVMMPNMDGFELCRVLKKDIKTSHIPIILLTAKAEDTDKIEGLETGADDYLIKPFSSKELLVRVRNLIELRRQLQEKYRRDFLTQPADVTVTSMDDEFLKQACEAVENHLSDPELNVEELSREVAMSRYNLHRKLRALIGKTPSQFIRSIRLRRAAKLLQQHSGTVTEIAFEVGFTNSAYFTKCFREHFGQSPSDYGGKLS